MPDSSTPQIVIVGLGSGSLYARCLRIGSDPAFPEKVSYAQSHSLGGITYWTIGDEADQPAGQSFFQMVRAHFPQQ